MRILFNSRKYDKIAGGVERMSIALMNEMVLRQHEVELMSLDPVTATTFYPLAHEVRWTRIPIGDPGRRANPPEVIGRLSAMRKVVDRFRPHVAIGFQQGAFVSVAAASAGKGIPLIAAERNAPQRFEHLKDGHGRTFQYLSFRLAKVVTVQFDGYREHYPIPVQRKIVSIPNPVSPSASLSDPVACERARKILLCVGRLSYQKNQRVLVEAFSLLASQFPDWDLVLVGEGEDRPALEAMIRSLDLSERVRLEGAQADVSSYYQAAQLFCLPSRWEGFPNVLAEAMACGLPSVGFADCAGTNVLIAPGQSGLLAGPAGTARALAEPLASLMSDPSRRKTMGAHARSMISQYEPRRVFDRWEALFAEVARQ